MKRLIFILISLMLIFSCSNDIHIMDNEYIPNAKKGEMYNHYIHLTGGKVNRLTFSLKISPQNIGIDYEIMNNPLVIMGGRKDYNNILIKGKPNKPGEIYLDFYWTTMGMNMYVGEKFQKRYILKVEE